MSMTATAASASSTATKPIGALIKYTQIAKAVQMTKPNTASHSRNVRALIAGAALPIPAVGSWPGAELGELRERRDVILRYHSGRICPRLPCDCGGLIKATIWIRTLVTV
jgi:hypothetical protein